MPTYKNFESASSGRVYTVTIEDDGSRSCNCPGWSFKRSGRERTCKHLEAESEPDFRLMMRAALQRTRPY